MVIEPHIWTNLEENNFGQVGPSENVTKVDWNSKWTVHKGK